MKPLSPKKYIITKARHLPFYESFINSDWQDTGLATMLISRKMPSGNLIAGIYLVDVFCLGMKDAHYHFNLNKENYEDLLNKYTDSQSGIQPENINHLHNILYGAIDYAETFGFLPHKDFSIAEYILDPDLITDGIDEIEFGKDGKPFFIAGSYDNYNLIISTLVKKVGEGNFDFLLPGEE